MARTVIKDGTLGPSVSRMKELQGDQARITRTQPAPVLVEQRGGIRNLIQEGECHDIFPEEGYHGREER